MNLMDLMIRIGIEDDATGKIDSVVGNAKNAVSGISTAITAAVGVVAAAGTAVGTYATAVGSAFESQMSKVEAISGATSEQMDLLTEKAKQMGIETKFSATEAGQAFEFMAMAGWKTEQMLDGISGIMDLSAASGENLASVSDIVTDALTAFGLAAEDSAHFSDVLAAASSNSNTNVALMGETFKYVAPVAGAFGFSIEETATAIGTLANAGIKGSQAGTQLRQMFSRLSQATVENNKYFGELIKDMGEAADTMTLMQKAAMLSGDGVTELEAVLGLLGISASNADGSMRSLGEILTDLKTAMRGLTQEEQAFAAKTIAGQEAMSGLLAIVNAADEDYNKLSEAIANADGASKRMANTMINNLMGSFTLLKSSAEGFGLAVYEHIKEPLTGIVNAATDMLNKTTDAFSDGGVIGVFRMFGEELQQIAPTLATSFIGTIGDAVERIGALAGINVTAAVDNIRAIGDTVRTVQEAFSEGGFEGGLASFVGEFAGLTGVDISGFVDGIGWFIDTVSSAAPEILDSVGKGLQGILAPFQEHAGPIISAVGTALREIVGFILGTDHSWIASVGVGIGKVMDPIIGAAPEIITNVTDGVKKFLNIILGSDGNSLASIGNSIVTIFSPMTEAVGSALENISGTFAKIMAYAETSGIGDNLRRIADATVEMFGAFTVSLAPLIQQTSKAFGGFTVWFTDEFAKNSGDIAGNLAYIFNILSKFGSLTIGGISDGISSAGDWLNALLSGDIEALMNVNNEFNETQFGYLTDLFEALNMPYDENYFDAAEQKATEEMIENMKNAGINAGIGVNDGIREGLSSSDTTLKRSFQDLDDRTREINEINSPSRRYARIGKFMAQGISVGWLEGMKDVEKDITGSMDFSTGNVSFSESASGKSSTGMINSLIASSEDGGQTLNVNVYLDGELVARNQYGYLRNIAKQKGEPVNA